ncbi:DUF6491 family protein [Novosphingobium sp. ZN18A2]|uniref:DUF6491 family protein n=1 Tax=Novosphingobium sp. ZN18A2 TaxID=3079861 RepID=UPI0030D2D27E
MWLAPVAALVLAAPATALAQAGQEHSGQEQAARQQSTKQQSAHEPAASIPFANHGGIWDWRSEGDSTVYFQDSHRQWYRAELFMPALDLPFVEFIGIDAGPTGTLDRFGAVYIHGQRYPFKSFVKVDGPPRKADHGEKARAEHQSRS